ncbi:MAG: ABC transporter ATP-binding protein [Desulfurococcales archaeon]|nr:ABC transporter ATP-binding protein [Desulfurococcales archaeon]
MIDVIEILKRKGIGLLIATHDSRIASISDRSYIVRKTIRKGVYVYKPSVTRGERRPGVVSLRAIGVDVAYPGSDPILRDVNVEARSGELVALIGPNGCGKTTLLRLLSGIMKPLKGRVVARGRRAYLPSNPLLVFSRPTLRDEVDAPPSLPVEDLLDRPIMSLSSGETQLAALAVIVSSGARILLLDEPTHALDPLNKDIVLNTLSNLADDGYTIIAASHDKLLASIADTVYRVECGGVYRE